MAHQGRSSTVMERHALRPAHRPQPGSMAWYARCLGQIRASEPVVVVFPCSRGGKDDEVDAISREHVREGGVYR
jgi:hypothetical protein